MLQNMFASRLTRDALIYEAATDSERVEFKKLLFFFFVIPNKQNA